MPEDVLTRAPVGSEALTQPGAHPTIDTDPGTQVAQPASEGALVFVFFSNRLGCLGSLVISIVLSALLILLMRGCTSGSSF